MMMKYESQQTVGTCRGLLCYMLAIKRGTKEN